MKRVDYFFRETAIGLRRNGIVTFAAMSTAFIALFLFGLALMILREFNLVTTALTGNVEVSVYLTDPVDPANVAALTQKLESLQAVGPGNVTFQSKDQACAEFKRLFAGEQVFTENVPCDVLPASLRVKLADPNLYAQITAALDCTTNAATSTTTCAAPGVEKVNDYRTLLSRLTTINRVLSEGIFAIAIIMLIAAVALIANTLRMGMFARRKEIGIMRLVGATNWRIRVPFLIEGLVESLLGAGAAVLALFLVKALVVDRLRTQVNFFPLVQTNDVIAIVPYVLIAGTLIAIVAGSIGMRRFLDV